jgi:hypothetical protein
MTADARSSLKLCLAVSVANGYAIDDDMTLEVIRDDGALETTEIGRLGFDSVHTVDFTQQQPRNRRRPDVCTDVDHDPATHERVRAKNVGHG